MASVAQHYRSDNNGFSKWQRTGEVSELLQVLIGPMPFGRARIAHRAVSGHGRCFKTTAHHLSPSAPHLFLTPPTMSGAGENR